jgi:hypothetical protein
MGESYTSLSPPEIIIYTLASLYSSILILPLVKGKELFWIRPPLVFLTWNFLIPLFRANSSISAPLTEPRLSVVPSGNSIVTPPSLDHVSPPSVCLFPTLIKMQSYPSCQLLYYVQLVL